MYEKTVILSLSRRILAFYHKTTMNVIEVSSFCCLSTATFQSSHLFSLKKFLIMHRSIQFRTKFWKNSIEEKVGNEKNAISSKQGQINASELSEKSKLNQK